jgi:hypothetical protein
MQDLRQAPKRARAKWGIPRPVKGRAPVKATRKKAKRRCRCDKVVIVVEADAGEARRNGKQRGINTRASLRSLLDVLVDQLVVGGASCLRFGCEKSSCCFLFVFLLAVLTVNKVVVVVVDLQREDGS